MSSPNVKTRRSDKKNAKSKAGNARRRQEKRQAAEARTDTWMQLREQAQLDSLDRRLGVGVGAVRQRARIKSRMVG